MASPAAERPVRLLCLLLAAAGCAHGSSSKKGDSQEPSFDEHIRQSTVPVPEDLKLEVERAEQIGAMLQVYDRAAWLATDAVLAARVRESLGLGGYIVLPEGDSSGPTGGWQAVFYSASEPTKVLFRVRLLEGQKPIVVQLDPPEDPVDGMDLLIRARKTAIASVEEPEQPLNPVIVPGSVIGEDGILVYLIAGTTEPKHAVFGRHYRVLVSEDGSRVLRSEPLSKSALVLPLEPPEANGMKPEALYVTHIVSSTPLETHVLASLQHDTRVLVATDRGNWLVDGRKITFLGARE